MHTPTRSADQPALPPFTRWELGHLVDSWAQSGRTLPVAVVVSIFDDLCEALAGAPPGDDVVVSLDHVVIDQAGVARMTVRPREVVPAVSALLREALAAGRGDEAIPAAAWQVLGQGLAADPWVRPAGTDVIQHQLREALGPPAARDEVVDCCAALASGAPRTSVSAPAPMPERVGVPASAAAVDTASSTAPWEVPSIVPMEVELGSIAPERAQVDARDPHDVSTDVATPLEVPSIVGPASELPSTSSWRPRWGEDAQPAPLLTRDRAAPPAPSPARPVDTTPHASAVASTASASEPAAPRAAPRVVVASAPQVAPPAASPPPLRKASVSAPQRSSTAAPTTAAPASPTTAVPTAAVPTTAVPTTAVPTTASPTTAAPTTAVLTTASPTTATSTSTAPTSASAAAERLLASAPLSVPPRSSGSSASEVSAGPTLSASSTPPGVHATVSAVLPEDLDDPPSLLPKPVVRHDPPRRRAVSLPAAPAARLGPTASTPLEDRSSSIQLPSESPLQRILIGTLALASAVLVAWLLGLI